MSIERKPRLHSERVACTETARAEAFGLTGVEKRLEQMLGARSVEKYLEPVFTGIASARHDTIFDSSDCARGDAKARYRIERDRIEGKFGYRRENRVSLRSLYCHQRECTSACIGPGRRRGAPQNLSAYAREARAPPARASRTRPCGSDRKCRPPSAPPGAL